MKRILIRGVNWIGDAILTIPAIQAVRNAFPDAFISLLVKPWVADIFRNNPAINEIILYEERFNSIAGRFKLARILKSKRCNSAILLQNAFDAAFLAWLAGIPERIGYSRDFRRLLLTKAVRVKETVLKQHHVYYYLNLLKESFNIQTAYSDPLLYLTEDEIDRARTFLNSSLPTSRFPLVVGINPGAAYGSAKRWMPERFAEVIQRIISELQGSVVLFGSASEVEIADAITSHFPRSTSHFLNMAGKTNLRELAALISECDAFISNDSGPMHMAAALFVPVVAIFGSTDSAVTGPLGNGHKIIRKDIACSPCLERECTVGTTRSREGHLKCMTDITADDVFHALKEVLPKNKAVFLDKDGTLIEDVGYLNSFSNLRILKGVHENLMRLKNAGFKLIGITNQSGIARGIVKEDFVKESNAYLQKTLGIDDFYYCPHHPDEKCQCRKPRPRLLYRARLKHSINLKSSYIIGDKTSDVLLAKGVGAKGILVTTGHEREPAYRPPAGRTGTGTSEHADFIARDFGEAVDWLLDSIS